MIKKLFSYQSIPLLFSIIVLIIGVVAIAMYIIKVIQANHDEKKFYDMLQDIALQEKIKRETVRVKVDYKTFWSKLLKSANMVEASMEDKRIDSFMYGGLLSSYAVGLIILKNPIAAVLIPAVIGGLVYASANKKINNHEALLNEQIPSFLSTFKANIQAGESAENALIGAINNTADPLYGELIVTRALIETGTFKEALVSLRLNTDNNSLRFLCSCIELANDVGANLEEQVEIIEELLESKKVLERKYDSAVTENKPLTYVASIMIPAMFIYLYISNEEAKAYWFKDPMSFALLLIVALLVTGATVAVKQILKSLKNF